MALAMTMYKIWNARNQVIFAGSHFDELEALKQIVEEMKYIVTTWGPIE